MLGGISLILGLFTRFFAAAAAIEMMVICVTYWQSGNGFSWMKRGYEYVLLWGLVCFARARGAAAPCLHTPTGAPGSKKGRDPPQSARHSDQAIKPCLSV